MVKYLAYKYLKLFCNEVLKVKGAKKKKKKKKKKEKEF